MDAVVLLRRFLLVKWQCRTAALWMKTNRDRKWQLLLNTEEPAWAETMLVPPDELAAQCASYGDQLPSTSGEPYRVLPVGAGSCLCFALPQDAQALLVTSAPPVAFSPERLDSLWLLLRLLIAEARLVAKHEEVVKLTEGIRSITSTLELEHVIRNLIQNALSVIPAADAGLLHLYDPTTERLVPKAAVGFRESVIQRFRLRVGESIAGKVFQDGQARLYRTQAEVVAGMHDISPENYRHLDEAKELAQLHGLMCVPLSIGAQRIGVLVLHQFHQNQYFLEDDLRMLQGFADQTAIALENARLFAETKVALHETAHLTEQLQTKHNDLVKRSEIHETFKRHALQSGGVERIVREMGKMLGRSVLLADWLEQQVIPAGRLPVSWDELALLFADRHSPVYVRVRSCDEAGDVGVFLYPLYNGTVFLGALVIPNGAPLLSDLERITVEQGSAVLTLDLVKKQSLSSVLYKRAHDFFQELLDNSGAELPEWAQSFGLSSTAEYQVVYACLLGLSDLHKLEASIHRLAADWKRAFAGWEVLTYGFHHHATMLLDLSRGLPDASWLERLQTLCEEWERRGDGRIALGIGGRYKGIVNIAKSWEEAKKAVRYLLNRGQGGVVRYSELGVNRLIANQSAEEIRAFVEEVFQPLWAQKTKRPELEKTLLVYMACNQSARKAADQLHIHINTLYQRLHKIEELLGVDLRQPTDVLKLQLACYLRQQ